ncbi:ATP-dependent DNA helicase RecG [Hydrogenovibrio crunogenus]|uniref:ATP-dependent DNA helicase RecG n=1 Tax=Hydrogenovibrio crunogenus TaxID=39765 RepID=A0A4P7P234_9GAMM|nr:ATP-dependent DNA helicase RecG [Hydrogenovibrio crunogenus]QBZ84223.1 ATP-dependent DNA helicase RecG [Hydrogenovibrio crunogenus]RUM92486.1 MAG: ATP-dependent DNA helicase RecG [Thiomicrospira sp.]
MLAQLKLTTLKGVGDKLVEKLNRLGLFHVQDLLFHLPLRYQDKTKLTPISQLLIGQEALIEGEIIGQHMTQSRNSSLIVKLIDHSNLPISCRFFHFHYRQAQQFKRGLKLRAYGEVRSGPSGLEIVHPTYQLFNPESPPPLEETLTPIYPVTEGLGQTTLLKLMQQTLQLLKQYPLEEALPHSLLEELGLPPINQSLQTLHEPQPEDDLLQIKRFEHPAQRRLIFEELLTHQLSLQLLRQHEKQRIAPKIPASETASRLLKNLPFKLTGAQSGVLNDIQQDFNQPHPMQRLIQGDVGSGKTIIAALAALQVADAGYQVAVMAPTEILAEQHKNHFLEWLDPLGIPVAWLNGRMKAAEKREALQKIESGKAKVIIGTHALFQDSVTFDHLGLVIIDEQHRFGVHQRLALHDKGTQNDCHPHQLIMTATPIPRTLAMTAYGDLDLSIIDELPPGRQPIETAVLNNTKRFEVMQHLQAQCKQGVQAYWVCPLIEESELLHAQAAEVTAQQFMDHWPDLRVGLIHGRLKAEEKTERMKAFKNHELDLLVATTVIEVGVNVPNASLMIIENAERLGLAQLHQLRGRVGRGSKKSHCVLLYQSPMGETSKARLNIMRESNDGFKIAEEDLKIRGPGEILGTRQTGGLHFRIADLKRDQTMIPEVKYYAEILASQHIDVADALNTRWLGEKMDYKHA